MADVTPPAVPAAAGLKIAQVVSLVKDNQLITALVVFVLWQVGAITQGVTALGGVC